MRSSQRLKVFTKILKMQHLDKYADALELCLNKPLTSIAVDRFNHNNKTKFREFFSCTPEQIFKDSIAKGIRCCYHEIIPSNRPAKLYFDFESEDLSRPNFEKMYQKVITEIEQALKKNYNHPNTNYVVLEAYRKKKCSVHVIFPNVWFKYAWFILKFIEKELDPSLRNGTYLDELIYPRSKAKTFRLVLSYTFDKHTGDHTGRLVPSDGIFPNNLNEFLNLTVTGLCPSHTNDPRFVRIDFPEGASISFNGYNQIYAKQSFLSLPENFRGIISRTCDFLCNQYGTGEITFKDHNKNLGGFRLRVGAPALPCFEIERLHCSNGMVLSFFIYNNRVTSRSFCFDCNVWNGYIDPLALTYEIIGGSLSLVQTVESWFQGVFFVACCF